MTISQPRSLVLGLSLVLAACGGDGLTLPPDGAAAHIEIMSGNGQSARVGSVLPESLVVRVTDTQDRPVASANVVFEFTADGSAASPASVSTDADGIAWSHLVLGTRVGPVTGTVGVPVDAGVTPVQATITATALAGDANGIALVSGNDQSGAVGTMLSAPLVVAVTDSSGNPIPGITIEWSIPPGGDGSVSEALSVTDANGQASVTRTLGPTAGQQTTLATAAGLAGSPVTFTHTATAGTATGVVKVSGDMQSGSPGAELALPLVVQVLDGAGNPIPNRALTWTIGEGGGSVAPVNTTTDAQGNASTRWTLGPSVGPNTVNAVVSGLTPATFSATATAGIPSASTSSVSALPGTISAGTGSSTVTVTVRDAGNNPVAGVSVTPASSGSENTFNPTTANAGANGVATFTFSSTVAEGKTISATAGGVAITDQATVNVQKVSSTVEITSDDEDPSSVGENVVVEFTVSGSGGTPTGNVVITVSGGVETCTGTLSNGSGSCTVLMTLPGTGSGNRRVLTATYSGDDRFSGDTDTENHRVDPLPTSNQPPVAQGESYQVEEDAVLSVPPPGVLANDTDPEGAPLTAIKVTDPAHGTVALSTNGSFTYTPAANYFGSDAFTYRANDGSSSSAAVTVSITVNPVNDAPSFTDAGNQSSSLAAGQNTVPSWASSISPGAPNEIDENLAFDVTAVTNPALFSAGPAVSVVNGDLTYTPATTGSSDVTVTLRDENGGTSAPHTFTITVDP